MNVTDIASHFHISRPAFRTLESAEGCWHPAQREGGQEIFYRLDATGHQRLRRMAT